MTDRNEELDRLDRLAAEHCMGWRPMQPNNGNVFPGCYEETFNEGKTWIVAKSNWRPTRDIRQAFECYQAVFETTPTDITLKTFYAAWQCTIFGDGCESTSGECATAPEAIVKACLRAKGVEL